VRLPPGQPSAQREEPSSPLCSFQKYPAITAYYIINAAALAKKRAVVAFPRENWQE
jgi:hypothetical protein